MTIIPDWLKQKQALRPAGTTGGGFLDKTLAHAISFVRETAFNEGTSSRKGFLQAVEPRIKLIGTLSLIVGISLEKSLSGLAAFIAFFMILALLSRLPLVRLFVRIAPAFLLTVIIAAPSVLSAIVPGKEIASMRFGAVAVSITEEGLMSATTLVARVTASVLAVFVQTMTTRPSELVRAIVFFLPGTSGSLFSISYRYIFFLLRRLDEFVIAFKSRGLSSVSGADGRRWSAYRIAAMFSMSLRLGRDLGMAMDSMGYRIGSKELPVRAFRISAYDLLWTASVLFMIASFIMRGKSL